LPIFSCFPASHVSPLPVIGCRSVRSLRQLLGPVAQWLKCPYMRKHCQYTCQL
jgi:hypothetical protein